MVCELFGEISCSKTSRLITKFLNICSYMEPTTDFYAYKKETNYTMAGE